MLNSVFRYGLNWKKQNPNGQILELGDPWGPFHPKPFCDSMILQIVQSVHYWAIKQLFPAAEPLMSLFQVDYSVLGVILIATLNLHTAI